MARGAALAGRGAQVTGNIFTRMGGRMGARMGTFWAGVVRETAQGAVTSAAQTAMQDETWDGGMGEGLSRVGRASARGGAVQGLSGFVADGLARRLGGGAGRAAGSLEDMLDPSRLGRATPLGWVLDALGHNQVSLSVLWAGVVGAALVAGAVVVGVRRA